MASHGSMNHSTHSSDSSARSGSPSNDWRSRANGLMQNGVNQAKNNPGMTAAIVGGVAAAAAATVYRDKIGGAISNMRHGKSTDVSGMADSSPIASGGTTGSRIDSGSSIGSASTGSAGSQGGMLGSNSSSMMAGGSGATL